MDTPEEAFRRKRLIELMRQVTTIIMEEWEKHPGGVDNPELPPEIEVLLERAHREWNKTKEES